MPFGDRDGRGSEDKFIYTSGLVGPVECLTEDAELESGSPWDSGQGVRVIIEAPEVGEIPDLRF